MLFRSVAILMMGAMGAGFAAYADPPHHRGHDRGHDLPPGLTKQGKIPPGHAKKIWAKGERLPVEYRTVYLDDWRYRDLREPPHGYRWVHVDNHAYLVEIASGLIADALVNALAD